MCCAGHPERQSQEHPNDQCGRGQLQGCGDAFTENRGDRPLRPDRPPQVASGQACRPMRVLDVDRSIKAHFSADRLELPGAGIFACQEQRRIGGKHTYGTEHNDRNGDETQGRVADAHDKIPDGQDSRLFSVGPR
jgi:hypothetical protein